MAELERIGNYFVLQELASGAFGRVCRGKHVHLSSRIVAVKLLRQVHLTSEKERESFFLEAEILEKLRHHHILPLYDVGLHQEIPYLVTQFAPGGSLRDRLYKQQQKRDKLLPLQESLTILQQIATALHHAHLHNVVHRDLKPENILFGEKGNTLLADFGISTTLNTASIHKTADTGTPPYMAPEQFQGQVSKESDQYALGCLAFELFTGHRPFVAPDFWSMGYQHIHTAPPSLKSLNPALPDELEQSVLKALEKERKEPYADVMAFVAALQASFEATTILPERKIAEQWFEEGKAFFDKKEYEQAIVAFQEAVRLHSEKAAYHDYLGATFYKLKRYEQAISSYQRAIQLNFNNTDSHNNLGTTFYKLKRYEEAISCYQRAIELNPNKADYHQNLGFALDTLKRYEQAISSYQRAIQLNSNMALYHNNLGNTFYNLKRYEQALICYRQAAQLDPGNATYLENKTKVLQLLKKS